MDVVYNLILVIHLVAWAVILGGWLTRLREPRVVPGVLHAALTAVVAGIAMVGIASASDAVDDPNNAKIGVKLVVALVVTALAWVGHRKGSDVKPGIVHTMGALTVANIAVAALWT